MLSRVMMVAGEASGDMHGAGVVRELKKRLPALDVFGIGGDSMRHEGMELVVHNSSLSFMGFVEVVKNLPLVSAVEKKLEILLHDRRPDVLVLIDYPGFNLRFARKAKKAGIRILYYISPQVWAWNRGRVSKMKQLIDRMKVVFPFEVDIYRNNGINVEFVGHPLVESIKTSQSRGEFFRTHGLDESRRLLALLPGSRIQEIQRILPVMAAAAVRVAGPRGVQIALGVAQSLGPERIRQWLPEQSPIRLIQNGTHDLMNQADAAVVTSGTATLETGWFGTPMVVVYKTSWITYAIGRLLVDVADIGLVNIVAGRRVVPELVQYQMTTANLESHLGRILDEKAYARSMRESLSVIRQKLGGPGASSRVADGIIELAEAE